MPCWSACVRAECTADSAAEVAAQVRALVPAGESVAAAVAEIVAGVAAGGDEALLEYERRFARGSKGLGPPLRIGDAALEIALDGLDADVRAGLAVAIANRRAVAGARGAPD